MRVVVQSCVSYGYLVHLERETRADEETRKIIEGPKGNGCVRTAYGRVNASTRFRKLLTEQQIVTC